jgi:hypothetical protein
MARSDEDERYINEYVALFHGRPRLQQIEMALALSERVLTGKDKPHDRQIQSAAADKMWRELGAIDWARIDRNVATRGGWLRVASSGETVRVYRFHAGTRTLIDRRGGRNGRIH